jgi:hypothetical protein
VITLLKLEQKERRVFCESAGSEDALIEAKKAQVATLRYF